MKRKITSRHSPWQGCIPEDAINALGAVDPGPSKREYLMPIPLAEINANKNMQQNTGY